MTANAGYVKELMPHDTSALRRRVALLVAATPVGLICLNVPVAAASAAECVGLIDVTVVEAFLAPAGGDFEQAAVVPELQNSETCGPLQYHGPERGPCLTWTSAPVLDERPSRDIALRIYAAAPQVDPAACSPDPL